MTTVKPTNRSPCHKAYPIRGTTREQLQGGGCFRVLQPELTKFIISRCVRFYPEMLAHRLIQQLGDP